MNKQVRTIPFVIPSGTIEQYRPYCEAFNTIFSSTNGISVALLPVDKWSPTEILSTTEPHFLLTNLYEALYLETFFECQALFRIRVTQLQGLLITRINAPFNHLAELRGLTISFLLTSDFLPVNPVILFLLKNTNVVNFRENFQGYTQIESELNKVIDGDYSAAVLESEQYRYLPDYLRANLRICGHFPIFNEQIGLVNQGQAIFQEADLHQINSRLLEKPLQLSNGQIINNIDREELALLLEGIEGLEYSLKEYIERFPNITIKALSECFVREYHQLKEKYEHQLEFSEKLVKLYNEVKESRDRLLGENRKVSDHVVIFNKQGKIVGASRLFIKLLHSKRQDIVGKNLSSFLEPQLNKSLVELIEQVDCGLVKSFNVSVRKVTGEVTNAKLDCNILESEDTKYVVGLLIPKSLKEGL
jgi:PAS domain-containing protein